MNINFYLYVYQHTISIYIFHQQKNNFSQKQKKLRPNNFINYSGAKLFSFSMEG